MVRMYARIRCPLDEAMQRYGRWIARPEVEPARVVPERTMVDLALAGEDWKGLAVFAYQSSDWSVIEEVSGGLSARSAESWRELAAGGDLVYAGYDDTVLYAELVVVERGHLVRLILNDEQDPSENVDIGRLPEEAGKPFADWLDVMAWVEADEEKLDHPDEGWLWIHRAA